ncbi:KamA family radical SAM protein [Bacteriovorax sp. Seq25_V]|uniref:KamA family radical SAM protein n=1 Tax=Bacteriovorax sp. Seq25_V TaxID=1201288 RepID=UPI00038A06AD|nr:KamA family radical SAM protein [Bacteriovorax sp. Seq25_V]EQC47567.1 KamA family protein [Bacteriovorax sp. Seq25_V]
MNKIEIKTWQDDFRFALKSIEHINQFFGLDLPEMPYDIIVPYNLAHRIKEAGSESVLWKQFIPSTEELSSLQEDGLEDPIGDKVHSKEGAIVHRYDNRILFFPTTVCPVICRYCFRKNELSASDDIFKQDFEKAKSYIESHPEIEEVIFSGGDPLMLSNERLRFYFEEFSRIPQIKYLRLHTRTPVILPLRIDEALVELLSEFSKRFETLSMAIHINHCDEIDEPVSSSLTKLGQIQFLNLLSQTVLLNKINDNHLILIDLYKKINRYHIKPYYLHHPDRVKGAMHFQLDIPKGRKIFANLRTHLPGWLLPTYILDIPGGHGKQPIYNPEAIDFTGKVLNKNGKLISI